MLPVVRTKARPIPGPAIQLSRGSYSRAQPRMAGELLPAPSRVSRRSRSLRMRVGGTGGFSAAPYREGG